MMKRTIRIATRKSPLPYGKLISKELLLAQWPDITIELLSMITSGDKFLRDKLLAAGGKGLFVKSWKTHY